MYISSYITKFFLAIVAYPTALPENPSRAYTWTTPNILHSESCDQSIQHCKPLNLTSDQQRCAFFFGLLDWFHSIFTNICFTDIYPFGLRDSMHHLATIISYLQKRKLVIQRLENICLVKGNHMKHIFFILK